MQENHRIRIGMTRLLLGFVLVTLGFAWGRQTAPRVGAGSPADRVETSSARLVVYAAHTTIRCVGCNQIEATARRVVEEDFAREAAEGEIEFRTLNFSRDPDFARKYAISSSTILLVRRDGGREVAFERLDEVWTKAGTDDELSGYIREAIRAALTPEES
ncbi:MAG: nitrophenyl compound nitroreductase subunit ArsF family protein [Kiritimatiellia bacterium]|nr:nitrophenyl compound nitroreductase subunit ArsF family protein [Kiritimatiellia bacterium]